jgi:hypothetical protein
MLHVTNADSAANTIRRTGIIGDIVPWRDILHEGPVPAGLSLEGLADVRARFLAGIEGTVRFPAISASFGARNAALRGARRVVLWFEHDLYDQLQLLEILAALASQPETRAELICINAFPGVTPFHGLGQLSAPQLATLWPQRRPVTAAQLAVATRAWKAFASPDPSAVQKVLDTDLTPLPFLRDALERLLEEVPSAPTGLSRTERQILSAVSLGHQHFADVFAANQQQEAAPFMGDTTVQSRITAMTNARVPLLTSEPYTLTAAGHRVLAGEADARTLNGIDRWIGGVHLVG